MHRLKSTFLFALFTFIVFALDVNAQISQGGTPKSWENKSIEKGIPKILLPPINVKELKTEDAIDQLKKDVPFRFAYAHPVNLSTLNSGVWKTLDSGDRIWMLAIESKGALSLNLTFSDYHLPAGATLFIYNADKTYKIGALTDFNNKPHRKLGTTPIPGDKIIIEYFEPSDVAFPGSLTIGAVAHAYRDIFKLSKNLEKGFGDSGDCNNNVVCPEAEGWENQVKSVAMITLGNGSRWCSGALLNNATNDKTPYFLTANHCTEGQTPGTMVFIFNYQSDICDPDGNGNDGELTQSISGATVLAHTNTPNPGATTNPMNTDMSLLLLSADPPDSYNVFYSGWDWSGNIPASAVGIHHPQGDVKKISFDTDAPGITSYFDLTGNSGGTTHWRIVNWDDGTTEGGSSGSPLFNDSKQVIGQLQGGQASCSNNVNDYYGRLALSFQFIDQWLDPNHTGVASIFGWPEPGMVPIDPGLHPIGGIEKSYCNENAISPTVVIENFGTTTLTELDLNYYLNGNKVGVMHWTGALQTFETDEVSFGDIPVSTEGLSSFKVDFEKDGDANTGNNIRSQDFYFIAHGIDMEINLLTDSFAVETSWSIFTLEGFEFAKSEPYQNNTLYKIKECVPESCFDFVIYDSFGDGICCAFGNGKYSLTLRDSTINLVSGGEFEFEDTQQVCIDEFLAPINPGDIVRVYPNPTLSILNLEFVKNNIEEVNVSLYSLTGQTMTDLTFFNPTENIVLNIGNYPKGVYILRVTNGDIAQSLKVVVL